MLSLSFASGLVICAGIGLLLSTSSVLSMTIANPLTEPQPEIRRGEDPQFVGGKPSANELAEAITKALERKPGVTTCGGTDGGKSCVFPFTYKGVDYYGCTNADHNQPWCSTIGGDYQYHKKWGNCHCSPTGKEIKVDPPTTCGGSDAGKRCVFPFVYKGKTHHGCTRDDHTQPWCSTTSTYSGKWGNCECVESSVTCGGTAGKFGRCRFPFHYDNEYHYDCITTSDKSKPWCGTSSGSVNIHKQWGFCGPCEPPARTCGGNAGGAGCQFPFSYKGKKYYDCTSVDHTQRWCYTTTSGKWGNCNC
eukprot:m.306502 g.306502  ORF g.306502 m.306502 type:complete len:305 (+) comp41311_c0_seq1:53-967(+)